MYYYFQEMFFCAKINSKGSIHVIPGKFKKNELKLNEAYEKRILKKFAKDKKVIYAFFLEIA